MKNREKKSIFKAKEYLLNVIFLSEKLNLFTFKVIHKKKLLECKDLQYKYIKIGATTSSRTGGKNALTNEFHLCALCSHILTEPITLICGCTFCKSCLAEYQSSMLAAGGQKPAQQSRQQVQQCPHSHDESMRKRKHDESTSSQPSPKSLRCFTCGNAHEHNSLESIKPNVIITKLVEKYWSSLLEIRHLRNDIRSYICHRIEHPQNDDANFDFDMFDSMLNSAYTLGTYSYPITLYYRE